MQMYSIQYLQVIKHVEQRSKIGDLFRQTHDRNCVQMTPMLVMCTTYWPIKDTYSVSYKACRTETKTGDSFRQTHPSNCVQMPPMLVCV